LQFCRCFYHFISGSWWSEMAVFWAEKAAWLFDCCSSQPKFEEFCTEKY
jgi:hypothetical protein